MAGDVRQTVLDNCSYGLYIVTSHLDGRLNGQISDALMQVTAVPPRVAVSINKNELTHEFITKSRVFAVSILSKSADVRFIGLFGFRTGRDIDKLSQVQHKIGKTGCPLVTEHAVSVFEAQVRETVDLETHTAFIGDVLRGEIIEDTEVLTYAYYISEMKGKVSKHSPSYHRVIKPPAETMSGPGKYICNVCGYVYDPAVGDPDNGISPGNAFNDLPDKWVCPICGVGKNEFVKKQ